MTSEKAGFTTELTADSFRIDMFDCPSKGFLIRKGQAEYHDYCAHCKGWVQPIMDRYDFSIEHERNDTGQCWWVMRKK